MAPRTIFVSGHLDLTPEEFETHYRPRLEEAARDGYSFVVGDARGCDKMTQEALRRMDGQVDVKVFHMLGTPRHNQGFPLVGGFGSDKSRDEAMTEASSEDLAWIRPTARQNSGTAKNLERRAERARLANREARATIPRWAVTQTEMYPIHAVSGPKGDRFDVPIPAELVVRERRAYEEWTDAQEDIARWVRQQAADPV